MPESSGQPYDFFASSLFIYVYHKGLIPGLMDKPVGMIQIGIMDIFCSDKHMLPCQWMALVDPNGDLPAEPLGNSSILIAPAHLLEQMHGVRTTTLISDLPLPPGVFVFLQVS